MRYLIFLAIIAVLFACSTKEAEPKITLGREWNATAHVVADTTSQFKPGDIIVIQMDNIKPFPASEVELRIYKDGNDRALFERTSSVKENEAKLTVKGPASRPLTVRDILRSSTSGFYRITFAVGDSVLAEKKMEVVK